MYTLGFPFGPWTGDMAIADGASILAYIRETAAHYGIDKKIRFRHRVEAARWSTALARWKIDARDTGTGEVHQLTCNFLYGCAGYYDYEAGYTPEFPGRERFRGTIVHPQKWPEDLDYAGKRVVVIGSGATAVTLAPTLAEKAAHVTMLQRSPTYIATVPARDPIAAAFRRVLPGKTAAAATRWKNIGMTMAFYQFCRRFPAQAKKLLVGQVAKQTRGAVDVRAHFTPSYKPWDQRLCLVPDADLFRALEAGTVSVVTDHIETFTERGIELMSGNVLEADVVVTATGLVLKVFGGISLEVDGVTVQAPETMLYKGMMCSGIPNYAFAVGYTNASWTLKCDLTSQYVCRLLNYIDDHQLARVVPRREPGVAEAPLLDFSSGYVQRSVDKFPRQGAVVPWKLYQNYALDLWMIRRARIDHPALEFT